MRADFGFPVAFVATLLLLGAAVFTGLRRELAWHLTCVGSALAALGSAIYFAVQLGPLYDLEAAGAITPVHLAIAKVTTAMYLLPIATGIMTLRDRRHRRVHFKIAMLVLALTVVTAITGVWMLMGATRL